jgi:hypothetical protein
VNSDEESEAETTEEDGSEGEFVAERKAKSSACAVPKWEVLAENRAVWVQFCKQLRLDEAGSLG